MTWSPSRPHAVPRIASRRPRRPSDIDVEAVLLLALEDEHERLGFGRLRAPRAEDAEVFVEVRDLPDAHLGPVELDLRPEGNGACQRVPNAIEGDLPLVALLRLGSRNERALSKKRRRRQRQRRETDGTAKVRVRVRVRLSLTLMGGNPMLRMFFPSPSLGRRSWYTSPTKGPSLPDDGAAGVKSV